MVNVVIWGAGKYCGTVIDAIKKDKCNFIGIADSNTELHNTKYMNEWLIDSPENIIDESVDYVVISAQYSSRQIILQCRDLGICDNQIIDYWKSDKEYIFIDKNIKRIYALEQELKRCRYHIENLPYESGLKPIPDIHSAEELLRIVIEEKKSLSRFGDGELEIMQRRERPWFQTGDACLSERLETVFNCRDDRILIALADNFGDLGRYTENAADGIREYLSHGIRDKLMEVIDMNRVYYDAYVTRPYLMNKDKKYAGHIFELFKKVWQGRDILLVEGSQSYIGIRNDLLKGAASVRRIIAPSRNAFSLYDGILKLVKKHIVNDTLVLVSLGPTATILAYDLAVEGVQAIDIGQLDNEYEWYLRNAEEVIEIPGKCVAGFGRYYKIEAIEDEEYNKQIIERICF